MSNIKKSIVFIIILFLFSCADDTNKNKINEHFESESNDTDVTHIDTNSIEVDTINKKLKPKKISDNNSNQNKSSVTKLNPDGDDKTEHKKIEHEKTNYIYKKSDLIWINHNLKNLKLAAENEPNMLKKINSLEKRVDLKEISINKIKENINLIKKEYVKDFN